jgi:hypothetical protein
MLAPQPVFRRLWLAQTVSNAGSGVSAVAVPLTAVLVLSATPTDMGVLGAASLAPALLLSLFVGVWVDRLSHRPILIGADLGRALLLALIPLAALLGRQFDQITRLRLRLSRQANVPAILQVSVRGSGRFASSERSLAGQA